MHPTLSNAHPRPLTGCTARKQTPAVRLNTQSMANTQQQELIIVKLGGAALTVKSASQGTLRPEVLQHCAGTLRHAWQPGSGPLETPLNAPSSPAAVNDISACPRGKLVVVHGAGSFGHPEAKAYGVSAGLPGGLGTRGSHPPGQGGTPVPGNVPSAPSHVDRLRHGVAATRLAVTRLNLAVVDALVSEGVPAVGLSPFGSWTTSGRELVSSGLQAVKSCLDAGLVPVLHGDVVLDDQQGSTILSGDRVVSYLAEKLHPARVVFLTDVAGVYDRPPAAGSGARLVHHIECTPDGAWTAALPEGQDATSSDAAPPAQGIQLSSAATGAHDTTGGMAAKVAEAVAVARLGTPVLIAEAGTQHAYRACCSPLDTLLQDGTGGRQQQAPGQQSTVWQGTAVVLKTA